MTIFTYGIDENQMDVIRWHFGQNEYSMITNYEEIFSTEADMVLVNPVSCDIAESTRFQYVSDELCEEWSKELYGNLCDISKEIFRQMTDEQIRMLSFFELYYDKDGYICGVQSDEQRKVNYVEVYRPGSAKMDLIIMSDDEDPISAEEYEKWKATGKYDRVYVDWIKEKQKENSLEKFIYEKVALENVPPLLKSVFQEFYEKTMRHQYAIHGRYYS